MTEVAQVTETVEATAVTQPTPDLEKARQEERNRFTREESLRRELEDAKSKLTSIQKNGWDLNVITSKPRTDVVQPETDVTRELTELKEKIEKSEQRRADIEELQSILDFTRKSDKYELIQSIEDAPKYVQQAIREHYKNTGKHISYAEACDFVESEIEKAKIEDFQKLSKTAKAKKIYNLESVETAKPEKVTTATTSKTPPKVSEKPKDITEPKNLHRSNSKEAFNFFRKKYGL